MNYGNGKELNSKKLNKIEKLLKESKMTTYEMEIKKLKNSPMNFDSLFLKIQSEY